MEKIKTKLNMELNIASFVNYGLYATKSRACPVFTTNLIIETSQAFTLGPLGNGSNSPINFIVVAFKDVLSQDTWSKGSW